MTGEAGSSMAEKEMGLRAVLSHVQNELHVPKDQYNSFGKYAFRNLESINAALKPLCEMYDCGYFLSDEVVLIGERFYTKATVTFWANGCEGEISSTAYAREEDEKKGMDEAQISGLASSYARKYAMCGMFAIDSGEEVDGMDNRGSVSDSKTRSRGGGTTTPKKAQPTRKTAPQKPTQASGDDFLVNLAKFAEMKGRQIDEVIAALNKTKGMQELGVTEGTLEYSEAQTVRASEILAGWIAKS